MPNNESLFFDPNEESDLNIEYLRRKVKAEESMRQKIEQER